MISGTTMARGNLLVDVAIMANGNESKYNVKEGLAHCF